jgi:hypothetical protein
VISANGRIRTKTIDVDGDGLIDQRVREETTLNADGSTSTDVRVSNRTNSLLVTETSSTVSADGLVRTSEQNLDGDIDFDRFVNETTVIAANGNRTQTITVTNADGSSRGNVTVFCGPVCAA